MGKIAQYERQVGITDLMTPGPLNHPGKTPLQVGDYGASFLAQVADDRTLQNLSSELMSYAMKRQVEKNALDVSSAFVDASAQLTNALENEEGTGLLQRQGMQAKGVKTEVTQTLKNLAADILDNRLTNDMAKGDFLLKWNAQALSTVERAAKYEAGQMMAARENNLEATLANAVNTASQNPTVETVDGQLAVVESTINELFAGQGSEFKNQKLRDAKTAFYVGIVDQVATVDAMQAQQLLGLWKGEIEAKTYADVRKGLEPEVQKQQTDNIIQELKGNGVTGHQAVLWAMDNIKDYEVAQRVARYFQLEYAYQESAKNAHQERVTELGVHAIDGCLKPDGTFDVAQANEILRVLDGDAYLKAAARAEKLINGNMVTDPAKYNEALERIERGEKFNVAAEYGEMLSGKDLGSLEGKMAKLKGQDEDHLLSDLGYVNAALEEAGIADQAQKGRLKRMIEQEYERMEGKTREDLDMAIKRILTPVNLVGEMEWSNQTYGERLAQQQAGELSGQVAMEFEYTDAAEDAAKQLLGLMGSPVDKKGMSGLKQQYAPDEILLRLKAARIIEGQGYPVTDQNIEAFIKNNRDKL